MIGVLVLLGLLTALWKLQQDNLTYLNDQSKNLKQKVNLLPEAKANDRSILEKDLLFIEKERVNAQNASYGTLVQLLGGAFFSVTAYLTWRNVKATEDKQITERFSKAVEQLGSDKLEVRLGGIYALERIAKDSEKDHWTIMEVLTSFVQAHSPLRLTIAKDSEKDDWTFMEVLTSFVPAHLLSQMPTDKQEPLNLITVDIQAALTVIGRRNCNQDQEGKEIDLSSANLAKFNFSRANFRRANLEKADFREANLGEADLSGANLKGARLDKINPDLPVKKVYFTQAFLIEAKLTGARLTRAELSEAYLSRAVLNAANLSQANLSQAKLDGANLSQADLHGSDLSGAILDNKTNFSGAKGLTSEQIKAAKNWQSAIYDETTRNMLGLP